MEGCTLDIFDSISAFFDYANTLHPFFSLLCCFGLVFACLLLVVLLWCIFEGFSDLCQAVQYYKALEERSSLYYVQSGEPLFPTSADVSSNAPPDGMAHTSAPPEIAAKPHTKAMRVVVRRVHR